MITLEKLAVYKKYKGDVILLMRNGIKGDIELVTDDDWHLITRLMSDIILLENNLSDEFRYRTVKFIKNNTRNEEVILALKAESKKGVYNFVWIKNNSKVLDFILRIVNSKIIRWIVGFLIVRMISYLVDK